MKYPTYYGNYLGIVIQNNDPLKQGRVKVFVPHISPSVYNKWNEVVRDKKFKFIGRNTFSDLTDILDDLKKILPWAHLSVPLAGESSSGRYNNFNNVGTISDGSNLKTTTSSLTSNAIETENITKFTQNLDNIGEKPGNLFDISYYKLKDAFTSPAETNVNNVNKYSYNYTPECYSNCAKGNFPIPSVGSHVWVFFNSGDPLYPVVFGSSFGSEDWKGIFNIPRTDIPELSAIADHGLDYPGEYENNLPKDGKYNINTETYRNKYVINQKGGTIAFINSDNRESLKLSHYSGSFKEFNNQANIELATNNDQKLVLNDQFLTVRGTRNEFTQLDYDNIVQGDVFKKIGNLKADLHKQWKEIYSDIAEVKRLFDIQRTDYAESSNGDRLTSKFQKKNGKPDNCPVCNKDTNKYFVYNNSVVPSFVNLVFPSTADASGDYVFGRTFDIFGGGIINSVQNLLNLGAPQLASPLTNLGFTNGPGYIFGGKCPACNGTGISPSSQGGEFTRDTEKSNVNALYRNNIVKLAEIEKQMGLGGSEIIEITKHKIETIGMVMNDFGSIRVDPKGKMYISEVRVHEFGTFYNRTPTPLVELVHVDDLPGGNYTLNVCNRYNVLVGAGGLNLKSYGVVNISGSVTNVAGSQINISSELETNIDGGKRLSLTGDVVSIKQRDGKQVVVEGSLGVTNNVVIAGGLHVEGEITFNHLTHPIEQQSTEGATCFAAPVTDPANLNGACIGFGIFNNNSPLAILRGASTYYKYNPTASFVGKPYIGFTDSSRVCGRIKQDSIIGYIKEQSIVSSGPCCAAGGAIQVVTNDSTVPVFASETGVEDGGDVPIYGSGLGSMGKSWEPVGIKPYDGCIKAIWSGLDGFGSGGGGDPSLMPIMVFGTGRDEDCIKVATHSHTYKTHPSTLKNRNADVREVAANKDGPLMCESINNRPTSG